MERTRELGREIGREWTLGEAARYETVTCRKLLRIEGPRSAWDQVSILHDRDSGQGRLCVRTVAHYERNGVVIT